VARLLAQLRRRGAHSFTVAVPTTPSRDIFRYAPNMAASCTKHRASAWRLKTDTWTHTAQPSAGIVFPVLAELGTGSKDVKRDWTAARSRRSGGELGKQSEDPSFLLIEAAIKEGNHVDESVCHL
jgi:hypothetical protein